MEKYFPRWLVITILLAVGAEQLAVRLPDVILAWDNLDAKRAQLHAASNSPSGPPSSSNAETLAAAQAQEAQAKACIARMELLKQNMIPDDFIGDGSRVKAGSKTARMIEQYNKDCGQQAGDRTASSDGNAEQVLQSATELYRNFKKLAIDTKAPPKYDDEQASMVASCLIGVRIGTGLQLGEDRSKKAVGDGLASCMGAPVSYLISLLTNVDFGSPHDLKTAPDETIRNLWISEDIAAAVRQCSDRRPGYAGFLACTCIGGAEIATKPAFGPLDAGKATPDKNENMCRRMSEKWAESDGPIAAQKHQAMALRIKLEQAKSAGEYAVALKLAQQIASDTEVAETKDKGRPGSATAGALTVVAWHGLFAREFSKSLEASDRSIKLEPNNLVPQTNRAHALMFLGRADEARAIYLEHKGEKLRDKTWNQVIAADFAELRKAGITHPMMAEIEVALADVPPPVVPPAVSDPAIPVVPSPAPPIPPQSSLPRATPSPAPTGAPPPTTQPAVAQPAPRAAPLPARPPAPQRQASVSTGNPMLTDARVLGLLRQGQDAAKQGNCDLAMKSFDSISSLVTKGPLDDQQLTTDQKKMKGEAAALFVAARLCASR